MTREEMNQLAEEILMLDPEQALLEIQQEQELKAILARPISEMEQAWLDFLAE